MKASHRQKTGTLMENNENTEEQMIPFSDRQLSVDEHGFDSDDTALRTESTSLSDELESGEDEFLPPEEENEAREINIGNIFGIIMIGVVVIIMIVKKYIDYEIYRKR